MITTSILISALALTRVSPETIKQSLRAPIQIEHAVITGPLEMRYLTIENDVIFSDVEFAGPVDFSFSEFKHPVKFANVKFKGNTSFFGAQFKGGADFRDSEFDGATRFDHAEFSADAVFSAARFLGDVNFSGMQAHGDCQFNTAEFSDGVWFQRANFEGVAFFNGAKFKGDIRFPSAKFGTEAQFDAASFEGVIESDFVDFDNAQFLGLTTFKKASFKSRASFVSTVFEPGINFDNANFARNVDFKDAKSQAPVSFVGAHFGGDLSLYGTEFSTVAFADRISETSSAPQVAGRVDLRDFRYDTITVAWRDLISKTEYDRQPYAQLEKALRTVGQDEMADEVYLARRLEEGKRLSGSWFRKAVDVVFYWIAGYGVRPWRLVGVCVVLVGLGTGPFSRENMVELKQAPQPGTKLKVWQAVGVSLQYFLPGIDIPGASDWVPVARPVFLKSLRVNVNPAFWTTVLLRIPGLILVPLLLGVTTGLLRTISP